jgi:tetratricopeptide (TPR) repeat protein
LAPANADVRVALGWALQDEGSLNEAGEHFRAAQASHPNYSPVYFNLGGLHEELGELKEAEANFREAIRLQPRFALPHGRLATLLRGKLPAADRAELEVRLADPATGRGARARLLFARAHVLDAFGEYPAAADCLNEANAITTQLARGKRIYVPAEHERFVDGIIRGFNADFFARMAGAGIETRQPIFVFGMPRSGTTLIEQVLAGHPQVSGAGELRFGGESFEALPPPPQSGGGPVSGMPHIDSATLHRLAERHLDRLGALDGGRSDRIVDKMPDNYLYLGLLATMFPQATFIHCRRDLRDVAVSCWMTDFRMITWANDPAHIAHRCTQYTRMMRHWKTALPAPVVEVNYEETVADLEGVARRIVAACHLDWDPVCLDFHRLQRPVRTASATQVRQPMYTKSLGRWKNYEHELVGLFAALPADS